MEERKENIVLLIEMLKDKFKDKYQYELLFDESSFFIKKNDKPVVHISINTNNDKIVYFPENVPLTQMVDDDIKDFIKEWANDKGLYFADMYNVYLNRLAMERTLKERQ